MDKWESGRTRASSQAVKSCCCSCAISSISKTAPNCASFDFRNGNCLFQEWGRCTKTPLAHFSMPVARKVLSQNYIESEIKPKHSISLPDSLESFRTVRKATGQPDRFSDSLESFSRRLPDSLKSCLTAWKVWTV